MSVERHLELNKRPSNNRRRRCIDGRYEDIEDDRSLARPGADLGYLEAILAVVRRKKLPFSPGGVVDKFYTAYSDLGEIIYAHTDHHTEKHAPYDARFKFVQAPELDPEESVIGCAHIDKAASPEHADKYGVEYTDVRQALNYLGQLYLPLGRVIVVNLRGEHAEQGLIAVTGTNWTTKAYDPETGQYFVYNSTRDQEFLAERLYPALRIPNLQLTDIKDALSIQTNASLSILKPKAFYTANLDTIPHQVQML